MSEVGASTRALLVVIDGFLPEELATGMRAITAIDPQPTPWLWGVNGAAGVLAAGLAVARGSPGDACGADVRHSGSSRVRSAVKQEPWPVTAGIPVPQGRE